MAVWWRDEALQTNRAPVYTLSTGWAYLDWTELKKVSGAVMVPAVPVKTGDAGRDAYSSQTLTLDNDESVSAADLGIRLLSSLPLLDVMLRIAGLRGTPLIHEPFSGGLLSTTTSDGRPKFAEDALVTRQNIYKAAIKTGDPIRFARVLNDVFERARLRRPAGEEETKFAARLFNDIVIETQLALETTRAEATRVVVRRLGFDPATSPRKKIRKAKRGTA